MSNHLPKLTIAPGTYRVRVDVRNPTPDRRKSDNWTAKPIVKAGEVLVIADASRTLNIGGKSFTINIGTIKCVGYSSHQRVSTDSDLGQALIASELEPIPESTRALLLRLEVSSWHLPSFLAHLVDSGVMTAAELEHEFSNWLDKPEPSDSPGDEAS